MKYVQLLIIIFLFTGCGLFNTSVKSRTEPALVKQTSLPPIPEQFHSNEFEFYCEMVIDENGNVEKAKIIRSSGDQLWDSLATISLLKWQFTPSLINNIPTKSLIRRRIKVDFVDPYTITLAEIICNSRTDADSVYFKLLQGIEFDKLVESYSISKSKNINGIIGKVNIKHYNEEIRNKLSHLKIHEFTQPLEYGNYFAIFKRLKDHN